MTAAAMASIRVLPPPALSVALAVWPAKNIPPTAAKPPEMAKTVIRIIDTLIPARRAASMPPPTAKTLRPYGGTAQHEVHDHQRREEDHQGVGDTGRGCSARTRRRTRPRRARPTRSTISLVRPERHPGGLAAALLDERADEQGADTEAASM